MIAEKPTVALLLGDPSGIGPELVAALNPHAGDGGNFGCEEIDMIAPAVKRLRKRGIRVDGPFPSDTIF